jgi:hypothetical protein
MFFQKDFERYLEILHHLETYFQEAQKQDEFPHSFFSRSRSEINELITVLNNMEETILTQHSTKERYAQTNRLGDTIGKKIYTDIRNFLSINDLFRFQRELFGKNADLMKTTMDDLNTMNAKEDVWAYLKNNFNWDWENESTQAFIEILEKKFT